MSKDPETGVRSAFKMLARAAREGWPVPAQARADAVSKAWTILNTSQHERNCIAAAEFLRACDADNFRKYEALLKAEKLEAGEPTEQARVQVEFVNSIVNRED
jgi:hypothetical protein